MKGTYLSVLSDIVDTLFDADTHKKRKRASITTELYIEEFFNDLGIIHTIYDEL